MDGINETALDGYDVKLTANLPYFYSSDVYFTRTEWNDGGGYTSRTDEFGLNAEIMPNLTVNVARQNQKGRTGETVASVSYSLKEAQILIEKWRIHYNTVRPHSSLGYRPPAPESIVRMDQRPTMH